ncbi:hypothetical protein BDL97_14G107700 [Sphagnum fallax]|nr:hypothetical protein BDL97_14G107700 [Sphagnum fallax]
MAAQVIVPETQNYWGEMPEKEFYASQGVKHCKGYFNTQNGTIFTQAFLPVKGEKPKGVVCLVHGYGSDTGWTFQNIAIELVQWGYTAYAADMLGHGRSDGIHGYVPNVDKVAASLLSYFKSVCNTEENKGLPSFLLGESMGGMVAFCMYFQDPKAWDGYIFLAPLLVMPGPMRPTWLQRTGFSLIKPFVSSWPIFPENHIVRKAIRSPAKQKLIAANPRRYTGKPRVGTMLELTRMVDLIGTKFHEFKAPFLTMHGTADVVADPEGSKNFYMKSTSDDKTLKLYDGSYHSLIQGEPDESRSVILADIKAWLDERVNPN